MRLLRDVLAELFGMFASDARQTIAILLVVLLAAGLIHLTSLPPFLGGLVLLAGCVAVLVQSVRGAAARRPRGHKPAP